MSKAAAYVVAAGNAHTHAVAETVAHAVAETGTSEMGDAYAMVETHAVMDDGPLGAHAHEAEAVAVPAIKYRPNRLPAAAMGIDEPLGPIEHGRFGAVSSSHLGGIGLDRMLARLAPHDQPDAGDGGVARAFGGPRSDFIKPWRRRSAVSYLCFPHRNCKFLVTPKAFPFFPSNMLCPRPNITSRCSEPRYH
jgi:hypothetical protein